MLQGPAALQGNATGGFKETRGARQLTSSCSHAQSGPRESDAAFSGARGTSLTKPEAAGTMKSLIETETSAC
jgi:hypothetical protein